MARKTGKPISVSSEAKENPALSERMATLGIPAEEMTEAVTFALSALFEELDDTAFALTRAKEDFAELEQLVDVDCIAPVPNRRAFMRRLAWSVSMHERYGHPCSLLYFDLNDLKRINDTYGHAAGDAAICHVSQLLAESLRDSDFVARLSGDEFGIIMHYATLEAARDRARRIVDRVANTPLVWEHTSISLTTACGAYEIQKGDSPESALSHADAAMYADKRHIKEHSVEDSVDNPA